MLRYLAVEGILGTRPRWCLCRSTPRGHAQHDELSNLFTAYVMTPLRQCNAPASPLVLVVYLRKGLLVHYARYNLQSISHDELGTQTTDLRT